MGVSSLRGGMGRHGELLLVSSGSDREKLPGSLITLFYKTIHRGWTQSNPAPSPLPGGLGKRIHRI